MSAEDWASKGNTHLDLDLDAALPYHEVIGQLVCKYANSDSHIIDLGCGLGHIEAEIQKCNPELRVDIADAYTACLDAASNVSNVEQRFEIDELTFNITSAISGRYDIAVLSHVLEHLLFPAKALEDIFELLKSDGLLIVAVPNPVRPSVFISNLFQMHYANRGHVHAWDRSHWRNFLENIMDYDVIEYSTDYIQLPRATRSNLSRTIGKFLVKAAPWWGFSNIAVIRKKAGVESVYSRWVSANAANVQTA